MKRVILTAVAAMLVVVLASCGGTSQPYHLDGAAKVEICAYDGASAEPFATVVLDGAEDVDAITEHFSSLPLKEQKYVEPSALGYELLFEDSDGNQLAKLSLPYGPSPWIDCGGTSYVVTEGAVDVDYLAQLVDIAISSGPMVHPESASFTGFISEIYPATNSLYIRTDPEHGFDAAYALTVYLPEEYRVENETKTSWVDITYIGVPEVEQEENEDGVFEPHAILRAEQIVDFTSYFVD